MDFDVREFVPRDVYAKFGDNSIWFLDKRIIDIKKYIAANIGHPCFVNNWAGGGTLQEGGFRTPASLTGAKFSQHKFGRAADIHFLGITIREVRQFIVEHWENLSALGATTIENIASTPTWLHIDCRWQTDASMHEVNP